MVFKWTALIEIFLEYKDHKFTIEKLRTTTGLSTSYISKYLSKWKTQFILGHDHLTGKWFLASEENAIKLISRAVSSTGSGLTTTPPPIPKFSQSQHHIYYRGIYFGDTFSKDAIKVYQETALQSPNNGLFHLTKKGDRAERIIIRADTFNANITLRTYTGTIYIKKDVPEFKEEIKRTFGDSVLNQIIHDQALVHGNVLLRDYREKMLKATGISVKIEDPSSQGGPAVLEATGITRDEFTLSIDAVSKKHLEDTILWTKVKTALDGIESRLDAMEANDHIISQTQARTVTELGRIATILDRITQAPKDPESPQMIPHRGQDPGIG